MTFTEVDTDVDSDPDSVLITWGDPDASLLLIGVLTTDPDFPPDIIFI